MSEFQVIESALEKAAARRRWARAMRGMWQGLLAGAILGLLLAGAYHVWPLPFWTVLLSGLLPLPCMALGLLIGGLRKLSVKEVARWIDGKQHLKERLSTALEVGRDSEAHRWGQLVVNDAAKHARGLDARRLVPFSLPAVTRWAVLVLVLFVGLGFVPEYRSKVHRQQQADKQVIKQVGQQLADLTRHDLQKRSPALESVQKSMEDVTALGDRLAKQSLTRSDALKDLANVTEKLKDQLKDFNKDPAFKKMEEAARAASGSDSQTAVGLQKQMESLQKQLGTPTGNPEALDKIKKELEKLQEAAKGFADKNSPPSEAERQKMSEALSALSQQMQEMGLQLPQLDDAINALAANQTDMFLRDLQAATTDLEKMREMAKSLKQLQAQVEKLGKDLAEQLKNGQPEAAHATLNKMIDQLKSANLSKEQLDKINQEVAKALNPASNYGKVAEHLKEATKAMESGDKPAGAQSLAKAAKELEQMMQQMGDAQELMATLENMNEASMCIGSGMGWKAGNRPGFNPKGGKPGSGVGTWSDNTGAYEGEFTERWDNSGFVRPDMDPRGHTDRGEGDLNDALKPTKVRGQFSQGGQMPSITLKGVSIKGQSKIEYEQAAAAAQADAQSALSQDKVPRAYQGAVKDYFDDQKK